MKPHLPAGLLAAVLATLTLTVSAADSININFKGNQGNLSAGDHGFSAVAAPAENWYNAGGNNGNVSGDANLHGASLKYNASATWSRSSNTLTSLDELSNGYLDDGGSGVRVEVGSLDFLLYDVYVYCSADSKPGDGISFRAVNVNGKDYTAANVGDTLVTQEGSSNWGGLPSLASGQTYTEGQQFLKVEAQSGNLVIQGAGVSTANRDQGRAGISGVQIVDVTADYTWSRTISGDTTWDASDWTNTRGDVTTSKTWADIAADADLRGIASLNGTGTVTLENAVSAEALIVASGSALTLSGQELNLHGLSTLLAQSGATLTLNNAVTSDGTVTISGAGSILSSVSQSWHGLSGAGTLEMAAGTTLALDGTTDTSFTGRLILNEGSVASLASDNFSRGITAEGAGTVSLAIDGQGASFGNSSVWRSGAGAAALSTATVNHATVNGNLTVMEGAGTFGKVETTISNTTVTGFLYGTNAAVTTGGFTLTLGEGNTINGFQMGTRGSSIVGDVTLNITGGVIGEGNNSSTDNVFALTARDGNVQGNLNFNVSDGTIQATDIAFGGFGLKDGKSITGNVNMHVTGGAIESNIYTGSTWGGNIGGDFTVLLEGGTMGKAGANRVLSAGACSTSFEENTNAVGGNVAYTLTGGDDGYGTSFLGNYAIYGGGLSDTKKVVGTSTITLKDITLRDESDATHGVANFTGVISGGNASGGGVGGEKALVFDNYQTLAQANFKHFDKATVQGGSHVTLTNAQNTNIGAWTVTDNSELTVTTSSALGGNGGVTINAGSSLIYDAGTSTTNESMSNALSGNGAFVKKGANTLTMTGTVAAETIGVQNGILALGNTVSANTLTIDAGAKLELQDGAQLAVNTLTNDGTVVVAGGVGLEAGSAALNGQVEWTGGTLTLGDSSQYAAGKTTLTGNASYMVLTLTGDVTSETTISFALGDLELNGGLLTFSMTGADTTAFSLDNFTLTTNSITGASSVSDSIFLSLNGSVYQGQEGAGGSITFASVGDLPTGGGADKDTNYKLNDSASLSSPTSVNNLFLIPTDEAAGLTLTMDQDNALTVNGTLTVEAGIGAVNLAGGPARAKDVKLTSGNLVLQQGAALTVDNSVVSTGGKIKFDGGTFVYGEGYTGDISSLIADGGVVKVTTSSSNVTWGSDVLAGHGIVKNGAGRLTLDSVTLSSNVDINVVDGQLAVNVSSDQTSSITADNKLILSGSGTLVKTGGGTWQISQEANSEQAAADTMSGNSFAGDILIEQGTLLLGKTSTGNIRENYAVSANALGEKGTIEVANGAKLQLGITQNATVTFAKNIRLDAGATLHTIDGNYRMTGEMTLTGDATIQIDWGKTVNIQKLIQGDGKLTVKHGGGETGTLKLEAVNAADFAGTVFSGGIDVVDDNLNLVFTHTTALGSGGVFLKNSGNTLNYTGSGNVYQTMANAVSGAGNLTVTSGMLEATGTNLYTGTTNVQAGSSLKVSGSIGTNASANVYNVAKNATLVVSGAGSISNSGVAVTAKPSLARDVAEGTLTNVTVSESGINRTSGSGTEQGKIENGKIQVTQTGDFNIQNVELVNSLLELQSAGAVTLDNVTVGAGTQVNKGTGSVSLSNSTLVITSPTTIGSLDEATHTLSVTSDALAGYTSVSGSLTLNLTKEFIDALVAGTEGNFKTIELTFTGTEAFWESFKANGGELKQTGSLDYPMFGPASVSFGDTAGTVIITTAPANIPEPATAALGLFGLAGLMLRRRRKQG